METLAHVMTAIDKGREQVGWALGQAQQEGGAARTDYGEPAVQPRTGNVRIDVIPALEAGFAEAGQAVMQAAAHTHGVLNAQAELAEIFTSVAPRLQGLVNRSIHVISEVERDVEDPDLMHEMFRVDHLLTQIRRAVESLAVLGGSLPSCNSAPILVATAIRRAVAEVPQYARVRVELTPVTAAVLGYVSPNLVHLLAALMENATEFSTEKVEVHTHQTDSGIAIEVLDRGTGMSQEKRDALNRLLAHPETEDPRARLRAGQLGLLVAALLAKRHKITIQLRPNIVGGTHAIVVLPHELLVEAHEVPEQSGQSGQRAVRAVRAGRGRTGRTLRAGQRTARRSAPHTGSALARRQRGPARARGPGTPRAAHGGQGAVHGAAHARRTGPAAPSRGCRRHEAAAAGPGRPPAEGPGSGAAAAGAGRPSHQRLDGQLPVPYAP